MPDQMSQWIDQPSPQLRFTTFTPTFIPQPFGPLMLWGIDELLTYHYLVAEVMRVSELSYEQFWTMPRAPRPIISAETVPRAPSHQRGLPRRGHGAAQARPRSGIEGPGRLSRLFPRAEARAILDTVFKAANVHTVVMTNDVLDPFERHYWLRTPPAIRASRPSCASIRCCKAGPRSPTRSKATATASRPTWANRAWRRSAGFFRSGSTAWAALRGRLAHARLALSG